MANMSYCRFENTLTDLTDCTYTVEEAVEENVSFDDFTEKLGSYERTAFNDLYQKAKEFIELVDKLSNQ